MNKSYKNENESESDENETKPDNKGLRNKNILKIKKHVKIVAILGILGIVMIAVFAMPVATEISYQVEEKYSVPYTVEKEHNVKVPYTERVAYTVQVPYKVPVYETIEHKDPVYKTLHTFELTDSGIDTKIVSVENVYEIERFYTGTDIWGNKEYKYTLQTYPGLYKFEREFYEINSAKAVDTYQKIVDYNTWSEEVIDHYDTKYRTETKYRDEPRTSIVVEYEIVDKVRQETKTVTKTRTVHPMLLETILYPERFV